MCAAEKQNLWHTRLGHMSRSVIEKSLPLVDGVDITKCDQRLPYDPCLRAKSTRAHRATVDEKRTQPLDLAHADIVGPVRVPSLQGSRYCIALYDDLSALSLVRFTSTKSDASQALKNMILELENIFDFNVKCLYVRRPRTDSAKEFLSKNMRQWLDDKGI